MYNGPERREFKRREKLYMAGVRVKQYEGLEISSSEWDMVALKDLSAGGALFNYNINLGIVDQLKEEDLCRILLKMCWESNSSQIYSASLYTSYSNRIYRDWRTRKRNDKYNRWRSLKVKKPNFSDIPTTPFLPLFYHPPQRFPISHLQTVCSGFVFVVYSPLRNQ